MIKITIRNGDKLFINLFKLSLPADRGYMFLICCQVFSRVLGVSPLGSMTEGLRNRKTDYKILVTRVFILKRTSLANFSCSRVLS